MGVVVREKVKGSGEFWIFVNYKGQRKARKVGDKKAAREVARRIEGKIAAKEFNLDTGDGKPVITFKAYADKWMKGHVRANLKESSAEGYQLILKSHILPDFGERVVESITRDEIKELCYRKKADGLSASYVRYIAATLSAIFTNAVEAGIVATNPAARPGRYIRKEDRRGKIDFLTRNEARTFLDSARATSARYYPLFVTALRTGMRLGELIALQWGDIDWNGEFIEVRRACWKRTVSTPKSGKGRRVDMSDQLIEVLTAHRRRTAEEALASGEPVPEWVFPSLPGNTLEPNRIRKNFHAALKKAQLRQIRFHDLRHSFASMLISNGESLAYVRDQLGHHSIQITVDTYGHLVPGGNRQAVNALDDERETPKRENRTPDATRGAAQVAVAR
jgi:integrase